MHIVPPPNFWVREWPSPCGTPVYFGPPATKTRCVWEVEVWYDTDRKQWRALVPFLEHRYFATPDEAFAWLASLTD